MATILYTTTENIRAVLGVTVREILDAQLTDLQLELQLKIDLEAFYPLHSDLYDLIVANTATTLQKRTYDILKLFCQYHAAYLVLPSLQTLLVQRISDGDAEMVRFNPNSLEDTIARITAARNRYLRMLYVELEIVATDISGLLVIFSRVPPTTDDITQTAGRSS